jgi:undecaprenyl-diphosphatase
VLKDSVEGAFHDTRRVLIELFATGALLFVAEMLMRNSRANRPVNWWRAVLIGVGQALAILPGISRSGATIAAALALGVDRREAGRFSFLMSIPVMLGASVLGFDDLIRDKETLAREGPALAIAFVVAALVGFLCIRWFLDFVQRHSLVPFAIYCWVVSVSGPPNRFVTQATCM